MGLGRPADRGALVRRRLGLPRRDVLRWSALSSPRRLAAAALAAGIGIELLQWLLPLGRVVSPLDALLNATGALLAGLVALRFPLRPDRRPAQGAAAR